MSSNLTWADVAHYYAKNEPRPGVYLAAHHFGTAELCGCDREYFLSCADAEDLPVLRELNEITEEDAREVLAIAEYVPDQGFSCKAWFAWQYYEYDATMERIQEDIIGNPAAWHYLISKNYNVFGVETYKGVKP
jgi:hypothetical protein